MHDSNDLSRGRARVRDRACSGVWTLVALACLQLAGAAALAADDDAIETIQLGNGIAMLVGRGGNIGVSTGPGGPLLIDDKFADLSEPIRQAVAKLDAKPIGFVINTHWHGDHTGGNENLGKRGAVIVAHRNVRERMSVEQFMAAMDRRVPASPPLALPVVTFTRDVTVHRNGHTLHVIHLPEAHTDGDALVHFEGANVLHTGDVFISRGLPFIDLSSGGSARGLVAASERALALVDERTQIIPGHGPLAQVADLRAYHQMVSTIVERVGAGIAAGKSLAEIQASQPVRGYEGRAEGGFIKPDVFVATVFESLRAKPLGH